MAGNGMRWTPAAQAALVTALRREKDDGRMLENGFKPQAWTNTLQAISESVGVHPVLSKAKSQWQTLRGRYKMLRALRMQSGFGWNAQEFRVTATDAVWDTYLVGHSKAAWFRTHPFPLYDDMAYICHGNIATGEHAIVAGSMPDTAMQESEPIDEPSQLESEETSQESQQLNETQPNPTSTPTQVSLPQASSTTTDETDWRAASLEHGQKKRRERASGAAAFVKLTSTIEALASSLLKPATASTSTALEPTTGSVETVSTSAAPALSASQVTFGTPRRERAWKTVLSQETALTALELAAARKIVSKVDLAVEYLSFPENFREARDLWLQNELTNQMTS